MKTPDDIAFKIYNTISGQKFYNWFMDGRWEKHISDNEVPREEIMQEIKEIFRLENE